MNTKTIYIVAGILLVIGLVWWFKFRKVKKPTTVVIPEIKK